LVTCHRPARLNTFVTFVARVFFYFWAKPCYHPGRKLVQRLIKQAWLYTSTRQTFKALPI
ncbi:MAG: hypothetical protein AAGD96_34330, partial [Chloroflexota bacterium]